MQTMKIGDQFQINVESVVKKRIEACLFVKNATLRMTLTKWQEHRILLA